MTLHELVVIVPFGDYQKGDVINDPNVVQSILDVKNDMHANISHVRKTSKIIEQLPEVQKTQEVVVKPQEVSEPQKSLLLNLKEKKQ
jgi:hypothetical protein